MQGLMIYENPVIHLRFTAVMKKEFDMNIDYTDRNAVIRAANALIPYKRVDAFLLDTEWDKDNPVCGSEEYLVENRILWRNNK
ncbi:hypothetical protein ADH76_11190 [Enterocloster clostridioformis]|uniref:hypothetical protein n=1 Tax=Enterocloster clostridioformis TaxID=1531 RepID=UPI00080CAA11|nr:hypothetical protein [Enterocloster clostridioformis]ANU48319.1 hypothetical protein A4V08_23420 [Lachnoclostridium sp. YL32]NDO29436.1 hypothetical protein [Enterocloster clostridioformis]OXE68975.1 hypothetical protein ADH76_11190 [Enterocloster clostridioformis]QQR02793.1 hypothetical protein I5Q83_11390 [Enterocloster clostridioformis]